jgi:hypothetical protein
MAANIVPLSGWTPAFAAVTARFRDQQAANSHRATSVTPAKAGVHAATGTARADDVTDESPS